MVSSQSEGSEDPRPSGYRDRRSVLLAGGSSLTRFILSAPAFFIGVPIYLALIGVEQYGIWVLITTFTGWLYFTDFGLKTATTRLAGRYANDDGFSLGSLERSVGVILSAYGFVMVAASLLLWAILPWVLGSVLRIPEQLRPTAQTVVLLGIAAFFIDLFSNGVYRAVADGLGHMARSNAVAVAYTYLRLVLIVLAAWTTQSVAAMAAASLVASILAAFAWRLLVRRVAPFVKYRPRAPRRAELVELGAFAGVVQVNDLIGTTTPQLVEMLLVRRFGLESLGVFDIGIQLSIYLRLSFFAVLAPVMPWLAGRKDDFRRRVDSHLDSAQRAVNFAALAGLGLVIAFAAPVLGLWLRRLSPEVIPPVLYLAAMGLVQGTIALYVHKWNADGRPARTTLVLSVQAAIFIWGALVGRVPTAIAAFGLVGAAAATIVATLVDVQRVDRRHLRLLVSVALLVAGTAASLYWLRAWTTANVVVGTCVVLVGLVPALWEMLGLARRGESRHVG